MSPNNKFIETIYIINLMKKQRRAEEYKCLVKLTYSTTFVKKREGAL